jgi:hypothetical protein
VAAAATADVLLSVFFLNLVLETPSEKTGYKKMLDFLLLFCAYGSMEVN